MIHEQIDSLMTAKAEPRIFIPATGAWPQTWHSLGSRAANAVAAALLADRPLLVRGEPGVGKSQLARAAATALGRRFIATVIQPDSEYQDLLWAMDHTQRLADAQLAAHTGNSDKVAVKANYIGPGALWWAFNWKEAGIQAARCNANFVPPQDNDAPDPMNHGLVLLIDEVDKADISLANGLLEVLGNRRFAVPPLGDTVTVEAGGLSPLVVLTSNDTRELPPALIRRCVVLNLQLPEDLQGYFCQIGATHFPKTNEKVLKRAAGQILADRDNCAELPKTGLAEYLDLLTALHCAAKGDCDKQLEWLDDIGQYFFKSQAVVR
ncbi:MAG: MoxR family ATPase [Sedimenticola sp.]